MAKITRATQKIFGDNALAAAGGIGEFGSLANGSIAYSKDPAVIQALSQYLAGWSAAVVGDNAFALEDRNALDYLYAYQLAYLMQAGVAEWDAGTTYYQYSLANFNGVVYRSLTDANINHTPPNTTHWLPVSSLPDPAKAQNYNIDILVSSNSLSVRLLSAQSTLGLFGFRSSTLASGTFSEVSPANSPAAMLVSAGSTLGQVSGVAEPIYIYALLVSGGVELAVSTSLFDFEGLISTTAEGGAGAADSRYVMYSVTARSNVPFRLIGKLISNRASVTTGWASTSEITQINLLPLSDAPARYIAGRFDGGTVPEGYIGETYTASVSAFSLTSGVDTTLDTRVLGAGKWLVQAKFSGFSSGSGNDLTSVNQSLTLNGSTVDTSHSTPNITGATNPYSHIAGMCVLNLDSSMSTTQRTLRWIANVTASAPFVQDGLLIATRIA